MATQPQRSLRNGRNAVLDKTKNLTVNESTLINSPGVSPKIKGKSDAPSFFLAKLEELDTKVENIDSKMDHFGALIDRCISNQEELKDRLDNITKMINYSQTTTASATNTTNASSSATGKTKLQPDWDDLLNQYAKAFLNRQKCAEKAELYEEWIAETPAYLPLKFRPKADINPAIQKLRLEEAQNAYRSEAKAFCEYAKSHDDRINLLNGKMIKMIQSASDSIALMELWTEDKKIKEDRAQSRWNTRKKFLIEKRNEALENKESMAVEEPPKITKVVPVKKVHPKKTPNTNNKANGKTSVESKQAKQTGNTGVKRRGKEKSAGSVHNTVSGSPSMPTSNFQPPVVNNHIAPQPANGGYFLQQSPPPPFPPFQHPNYSYMMGHPTFPLPGAVNQSMMYRI